MIYWLIDRNLPEVSVSIEDFFFGSPVIHPWEQAFSSVMMTYTGHKIWNFHNSKDPARMIYAYTATVINK